MDYGQARFLVSGVMPSICFVAGDPSGDAHAARLIGALRAKDPTLTFTGLGGPAMRQAGASLLDDLTATAAIGPFDAARHLGRFFHAKQALEEHLRRERPELAVLVDFGDFNLPVIAPLVKRFGIPIVYYISPQVWAWGRWRLRFIRRHVDRMLVFFPFEETFYRREGIPVTWVGHPLIDHAKAAMSRGEARKACGLNPWRRTVGLLPGSREQEIARHLPLMMRAARRIAWRMPGVQFLLPRAPSVSRQRLDALLTGSRCAVQVAEGSTYDALQLMDGALIASGTATLEAALCEVPMIVVYRASWPTYLGARLVLRIPHIAIVNILAGRRLVPEFIQHQASPRRVAAALIELLRNDERCEAMRQGFREIRQQLGPPGAVERAAQTVLECLRVTVQ